MHQQFQDAAANRSAGARQARGSARAATIALVGALVLCLLAAQMLVSNRAGNRRARRKAAELVAHVAQQGLTTFFSTENTTRYYLLEKDDQLIGYGAATFQIDLGPGSPSLRGDELRHFSQSRREHQLSFQVANDLSRFEHMDVIRGPAMPERTLSHYFQSGVLVGDYALGDEREIVSARVHRNHLIPLGLVDLFSSLAADAVDALPAVFAVIISSPQGRGSMFSLRECIVRPGGEVPYTVTDQYPVGHTVTAEWITHDLRQTIYYDQMHQLLWQKNSSNDTTETIRAVSRRELLQAYPEAGSRLDSWLESLSDEEDENTATL